jgi:hypothetical protein
MFSGKDERHRWLAKVTNPQDFKVPPTLRAGVATPLNQFNFLEEHMQTLWGQSDKRSFIRIEYYSKPYLKSMVARRTKWLSEQIWSYPKTSRGTIPSNCYLKKILNFSHAEYKLKLKVLRKKITQIWDIYCSFLCSWYTFCGIKCNPSFGVKSPHSNIDRESVRRAQIRTSILYFPYEHYRKIC